MVSLSDCFRFTQCPLNPFRSMPPLPQLCRWSWPRCGKMEMPSSHFGVKFVLILFWSTCKHAGISAILAIFRSASRKLRGQRTQRSCEAKQSKHLMGNLGAHSISARSNFLLQELYSWSSQDQCWCGESRFLASRALRSRRRFLEDISVQISIVFLTFLRLELYTADFAFAAHRRDLHGLASSYHFWSGGAWQPFDRWKLCCYLLLHSTFVMCCPQVSEEECNLICEGRHEDQLLKSYLLSEIKTSHENSSKGPGSAKHRKGS